MNADKEALLPGKTFLFNSLKRGYKLRSQLSEISNSLKTYEKVSVIFLLCETPQNGLDIMDAVLDDKNITSRNDLFYKWLRCQGIFTSEDWPSKLAELLTILQNYKLAKILGFTKAELIERFEPKNNLKAYNISCLRKVLYNLSDDLTSVECSRLITITEGSGDSMDPLKSKYLEYTMLMWSKKGIINLGNNKAIDLKALVKSLKSLKYQNFISDIEVIVEKTNCQNVRSKSTLKLEYELSKYYEIIDVKNLGLCVIINEKNFTNSMLPKRWGSDKDAQRLIEVFTAFGFDIKLHVDLSYEHLIDTLSFYAKTVNRNSSFFVLIILSHGSENVIFTSDSLPVDINTIEMIFQAEVCPNLIGKPKIFIVQSCQGQKWQKVMQDLKPEIETDNSVLPETKPSVTLGPQKGDSIIAWSTVQGFASFRDKYNGSWYIQELCNELWKFGDSFDLVEIFTKVNNNLRSKVYSGQFMVPSLLLSVRAKVQLPNLKENFLKGRKLMFERLVFEKCFKDFLINSKYIKLDIAHKSSLKFLKH